MNPPPASPTALDHDPLQSVSLPVREALMLVERIGGRPLLEKVRVRFRATSNARMEKIHDALAGGDTASISRLAHELGGSSAQIGAEELRRVATSIEKNAAAIDPSALAERVERLGQEVRGAWVQLDEYLAASTDRR